MTDADETSSAPADQAGKRTREGVRARRQKGRPAPDSGRHRARRNAMMVLYNVDLVPRPIEEAISAFPGEHDFPMPAYTATVVRGVTGMRDQLDEQIQALLVDWQLSRLGAVERAILRIAMWELETDTVPPEIAIDEAVELAKRYASAEAARLVNGVLGTRVKRGGA